MAIVRPQTGSRPPPTSSPGGDAIADGMLVYGRRVLGLLRSPGGAGRFARVIRREWSAGGLRGLLAYVRRVAGPASNGLQGAEASYREWIAQCDTLTDADRVAIARHVEALAHRPLISVVVPVYNTAEPLLRAMIGSVQAQLYPHWELCLADDASPSPHVSRVLAEYAAADPRIRWVRRETNGHICAASNSALALARGEFVALVDHDDLLSERALYEVVAALDSCPDADLIYTDEDKLDEAGERYGPYFKPDFSPDLLLGQNVISHFGVYRRSVIEAIGGFREGYEGSQDYDLALRVVAHSGAEKVCHVPAILYHWRQERGGGSFSQSQLDRCIAVARRSIQEHVDAAAARGADGAGRVTANPVISTWSRIAWTLPDPAPLVSVIVSASARPDLLRVCVDGLLRRTAYPRLEVLVAANDWRNAMAERVSAAPVDARLRVLTPGDVSAGAEPPDAPLSDAENMSGAEWINRAARAARGDILLLLDSAADVVSEDWLSELAGIAARPGVGAAGAKLLRPDGRIHHAGLRLGPPEPGAPGGDAIAQPLGHLRWSTDPGYFGHYAMARDVGAVQGACLAIRREVYERVNGLDTRNLTGAFHDLDLCLRVRQAGYRVVWTPFATLAYRGVESPGAVAPAADLRHMATRWGEALAHDPYYNINFDPGPGDYRLAIDSRRQPPWSAWLGTTLCGVGDAVSRGHSRDSSTTTCVGGGQRMNLRG